MMRPILLFLLTTITAPLAVQGCGDGEAPGPADVPVRVGMVALDSHNVPVIVLEEEDGSRLLPIWIGMDAAQSITTEIEQKPSPRPNTHDLAKRVNQGLDGEIVGVRAGRPLRLHLGGDRLGRVHSDPDGQQSGAVLLLQHDDGDVV